MLETFEEIVVPGGGTLVIPVETGGSVPVPLEVLPDEVPLMVKIPPIGALGGMVLVPALAASVMNSARVLPEVGLKVSECFQQLKVRTYALILPTMPA